MLKSSVRGALRFMNHLLRFIFLHKHNLKNGQIFTHPKGKGDQEKLVWRGVCVELQILNMYAQKVVHFNLNKY